ncbi:hypothetical protein [Amycolatopsis aidingensis]|uniref:hypothetical protein n=1 Tax=Amycolatopsis aidingensis TaxID=2842453 RepID=UPI001C0B4D55|nr:hypothetical protein [Amycolatopsis aidingensis]
MAEHAQQPDNEDEPTRAMPAAQPSTQRRQEPEPAPPRKVDWRAVRERAAGLIAGIVRWIGLLFALVLVLHVVFVIGDGNPDNGIVSFVNDVSDTLVVGFKDMFTPEDAKLRALVNYGIAAVFWLVVSAILARIIRRVGGASL